MLGLRDEITRTFLRLRNRNPSRLPADEAQTVLKPDGREGTQLGNYRILKKLGAGGMGHVYLALDTRLGRHVALKFLPPELTSDPNMLLRLEGEARTTSALNHPNIVTIYEIVRLGNDVCIASEFVDGATLRTAITRGAMGLDNAIDIASQVASALIAAHAAGVVHRDLKPGNIMIRHDGYVKVIDFGLAKYAEPAGPGESARSSITRPGNIVGTIDYMSPEQARGEPVDHRTDLWSLGVILYEMVSSRLPFEGPTDSHVMVGILDHPIAPLPKLKALPPGLLRVIERTLAKDRNKRYRSATELLTDLQAINIGPRRPSQVRVPHPRRLPDIRKILAAAFILGALALTGSVVWWRTRTPDWFQIGFVRQMTDNGRALLSAISPDGRYLAYVAGDLTGQETLVLRQIDSPAEEVKIGPRKITYSGLAFSPDGQSIYESEKDDTMVGKLYSVPLLGSRSEVPILTGIDGSVTFAPSGDRFAFVNRPDNGREASAIEIAGLNGSGRHKLISFHDWTVLRHIAWSGRDEIAAFLFNDSPGGNDVGMLDLIDANNARENRRPIPGWRLIGQPVWTADAKGLIVPVATRTEANNQVQIREIAVWSGEVRDVTKDLARYQSLSVSADRNRLAMVKMESRASLWISSGAGFAKGRSVFAEAEDTPALAWTDPTHLAVHSNRTGFPNLMLVDVLNLGRTSLTNEPFVEQGAAAVPGSKWIVMASNRSGQFHIWKFNPDTNEYVQLTSGSDYDQRPSVSPDGHWVVCAAWPGPHLRKISISGGPASDLGSFQAKDPVYSPDGRFLACQRRDLKTNRWTTAVFPVDQPDRFRSFPNVQSPVQWLPDGKALASILTEGGVSNIWALPLDGSPPRKLTNFDDQAISTFAFSPASDRLACIRASQGADVVLFKKRP